MTSGTSTMITTFKDFWNARESREQWILGLGLAALILMLFYQLIWTPIDHWAGEQQSRMAGNAELAAYVSQAKVALSRHKSEKAEPASPGSDLTPMQLSFSVAKAQGIDRQIDKREPTGDDGIRLQFSAVDFSALGRWIAAMNQAGLVVDEAEITRATGSGGGPGLVDARIKMTRPAAS